MRTLAVQVRRECRPASPTTSSPRAWTWTWERRGHHCILCAANCLKSRLLKLFGNEKVSRRREDQGALRRAGAELGTDHRGDPRGVKRSLAGGSAGACWEAVLMAHGSRAASPPLLGCTRVSRSARWQDEGIDWVGTSRSRRARENELDSDETPDGLRQGALLACGLQRPKEKRLQKKGSA